MLVSRNRKRIFTAWTKALSGLIAWYRAMDTIDIRTVSDAALKKYMTSFNSLMMYFWESGMIPELGAYGGKLILTQELQKYFNNDSKVRQYLGILSAPTKPSFYQEEEIALAQTLLAKYPDRALQRHRNKHFWIKKNSYAHTQIVRESAFAVRAKAITYPRKELQRIQRRNSTYLKRQRSRAMNNVTPHIRRTANALADCIWWQDQRKKEIFHYLHYYHQLVDEYARRACVPKRLFNHAWPHEVGVRVTSNLQKRLQKRIDRTFILKLEKK